MALHEYDQAMEQLRQVTATGRSRRLEATCLLNTGKPEEAAKAIADARSMGEDSAALSLLEAELLDQNGKPEDAAQLLRKSIATYPAEAQLYYQLGLILQKLGQTEEATARMKEWEGYSQLSTQLTELNLKAVADQGMRHCGISWPMSARKCTAGSSRQCGELLRNPVAGPRQHRSSKTRLAAPAPDHYHSGSLASLTMWIQGRTHAGQHLSEQLIS